MEYVAACDDKESESVPTTTEDEREDLCNEGLMLSMSRTDIAQHSAILNRYRYCIVWTPIPMLTWLLPFIGQLGFARLTE